MKRFFGIVLALVIMFVGVQPVYANQHAEVIVPVVAEASIQMLTSTNSAVTTITVTKADAKTAKKIHEQLMKRKSVKLKVKGSRKTAEAKLKKLQKQLGPVNQIGVQFQYVFSNQANGYADFLVSKENAKCYYYAVKFMKKLNTGIRRSIEDALEKDYQHEKAVEELLKRYPDERTQKLALAYNYFGKELMEEAQEVYGFEKQDIEGYYKVYGQGVSIAWNFVNEHIVKEQTENAVFIKTFEEFLQTDGVDVLIQFASEPDLLRYGHSYVDERMLMIYETPFYKLSDAMKIYAIDYSSFFGNGLNGVGMTYDSYCKPVNDSGSSALKKMYENKAIGVCHNFAIYEVTLFRSLGIECYYNSLARLDHAWSVVKVKNSKGKTLWIPFDYGIGPSVYANLTSEKVLYEWYLGGIEGAPLKKNYTEDDFN